MVIKQYVDRANNLKRLFGSSLEKEIFFLQNLAKLPNLRLSFPKLIAYHLGENTKNQNTKNFNENNNQESYIIMSFVEAKIASQIFDTHKFGHQLQQHLLIEDLALAIKDLHNNFIIPNFKNKFGIIKFDQLSNQPNCKIEPQFDDNCSFVTYLFEQQVKLIMEMHHDDENLNQFFVGLASNVKDVIHAKITKELFGNDKCGLVHWDLHLVICKQKKFKSGKKFNPQQKKKSFPKIG